MVEEYFDFDLENIGIDVVVELRFDFVTNDVVDFDLQYFDFDEGKLDLDFGMFDVVVI